jgi:hypothetical protein
MTIFRCPHDKKNPYAQINREILTDPYLSWAAKGLLVYLLSLPDNWKIQVIHLSKICKKRGGKEDTIYSLLNELIEEGYCYRSQPLNEKKQFKDVDYVISEFKKCLPHREVPDAVIPEAVPSARTDNILLKKKTTTKKEAAVVFSCLKDRNDLTPDEKQSLMRYSEERVLKALEFAKFNPPKQSLIQELIWHCKQKEPPISAIQGNPEENRELAKKYEKKSSVVVALNKHVEFVVNGPYQPTCIDYDDNKFKEKFEDALRKFRIKTS